MDLLMEGRFVVGPRCTGPGKAAPCSSSTRRSSSFSLFNEGSRTHVVCAARCNHLGRSVPLHPLPRQPGSLARRGSQAEQIGAANRQPRDVALQAGEHTAQVPTEDRLELETHSRLRRQGAWSTCWPARQRSSWGSTSGVLTPS